jgi:hypothetical protein
MPNQIGPSFSFALSTDDDLGGVARRLVGALGDAQRAQGRLHDVDLLAHFRLADGGGRRDQGKQEREDDDGSETDHLGPGIDRLLAS